MTREIQHADPRLRRITVVVLVIAAAFCAGVLFAFRQWLPAHAATVPTELLIADLRRWLAIAAFVAGLCMLLLAWHAARLAGRTLRERRWPLADRRVLVDTPVRHGDAAARMGWWLNAAAVVLVVACVLTVAFAWHLLRLHV